MSKNVGNLLAVTFWVKVDKIENSEKILVEDLDNGNKFHIQGRDLLTRVLSADEFSKTEKITKTAMAEKFVTLFNKPFTVCYDTQKENNRVLRGKLIEPEHLLGRSYVEDLDIPLGTHRMRQVDHRTIHWLVVDNVKYVVK